MRARFVALILALAQPFAAAAETLEFIGQFNLETEIVYGLSGIEVSEDGMRFAAVSDQGWWFKGAFVRDGKKIRDIAEMSIAPILASDGTPVAARRVGDWSDAEGLATYPDGRSWVAFERWPRVARYDGLAGNAHWIKDHPTFYDHAENWQLEAVAVSPRGTVYAFSEKPLIEGFPIYRLAGKTWVIDGYLPEQDVFAIVGADFDENGDLYLLERKLVVGLWWQNRVRRVKLDGSEDVVLWTGERDQFDNLEGLSVWRDEKGLRMTLVSDNNGSKVPTQFVEFRLTE
ncbi:MAG: esterase-like activity of phytase family protein [Paracoccaceae bacterium]